MPITLKGIRLETVNLQRSEKSNGIELTNASYSLISSADLVLANQSIGGYGSSVTVNPSPATLKLLAEFISSYKKDITTVLGLDDV